MLHGGRPPGLPIPRSAIGDNNDDDDYDDDNDEVGDDYYDVGVEGCSSEFAACVSQLSEREKNQISNILA